MDTVILPFEFARERILKAIRENQVTIILGRTGSGKTTQIPQLLLDNGLIGTGQMIACTQPRALATIGVTNRVASERKQEVGKEVGYQIRFMRETSEETRLKFMTCGILLREMLRDPLLSSYACVIVDEAHERDVFTDLLLGYLRVVCQKRPAFKVIVMSATLDWRELERFFSAVTVRIPVPVFPVEITYKPVAENQLLDQLARDIPRLHQEMKGVQDDMLVFLPGEWEIRTLVERLALQSIPGMRVFPLYGSLSPSQQREALRYADERKVIVATNIAESSLTLGKVMVFDSGLAKIPCFDGLTGIESLELVKISQSSAEQRTGRAGRVAPGKCIRYYSENDFFQRPRYDQPAAERSDLTPLVLMLKSLDFGKEEIVLPCDPPSVLWTAAEQRLKEYGALDDDGMITRYGRDMAALPVEPALAHFILQNRELSYGCLKVIVTMAAMLSVGRFFVHDPYEEQAIEKAKQKFMTRSSDFFTLFKLWKAYEKANYSEDWCAAHYLNPHWMRSVRQIRVQLLRWVTHKIGRTPYGGERESLSCAILRGFSGHLLEYHRSGVYRLMSKKIPVSLARDSALAAHLPEYAVCYKMRRATTARVFADCSHTVKKDWLVGWWAKPMAAIPEVPAPHKLRMTGTLRMERANDSRMIHLDIDLMRSQSTIVQCVDQGSLVLDEERYPVTLLNFSPDTLAWLDHERINTLGNLLRAKHAFFANQDVASHIRSEVETLLTGLGYIPRKEDVQPKPFVHKEPVEEPVVSVAAENDADNSGSLLRGLLVKPITALTLSASTLMRLWGLGINTINDLIGWEESRLVHAMLAAEGSGKRETETACLRAVGNAKERLAYFELSFAPETKAHRGVNARKGFMRDEEELIVDPEILSLQPEMLVSEEVAAEKLGNQYPLFRQFREAQGEEQIILRNQIATVNHRLPGKFSRSRAPQLERRRVGGKIKEEALEEQDLFQEGSLGLLRGVELYDYQRGTTFSTYASLWIKQYISRAIDNQLYPVRVPMHMSDSVRQFVRKVDGAVHAWHAHNPLQDPTREEIAKDIGISVERFEELSTVLQLSHLLSLDERVRDGKGREDEIHTFGDLIADSRYDLETMAMERDEEEQGKELARELLAAGNIKPIDRQCVVLWFGLEGNREHTLDEIGQRFGVTRERIRQRIAQTLDSLRTQKNWEMARRVIPKIAQPTKIRKTDIVLRDSPHDRITRLERRNEDIAHDILSLIAREYSVSGEVLRSGADLGGHLQPIRRYVIGEMHRSAKLSTGFIAFFFNLTMEMVEEEAAVFLAECENIQEKGSKESERKWFWEAMKIAVQTAETRGLKPEQLFGFAKTQDDDALNAARRAAIVRLREELKLSFNEIANFLCLAPEVVARSFARKSV